MKLPEPIIQAATDKLYELVEDYSLEHKRICYTVKKGFRTDGESIPRAVWFITGHPFQGLGLPAAVIHDILYGSEYYPREKADLIFKQLLERNGVNWFRAMMRYRFLRMFGGLTWKTHTDATRAEARKFLTVKDLTAPPSIPATPA